MFHLEKRQYQALQNFSALPVRRQGRSQMRSYRSGGVARSRWSLTLVQKTTLSRLTM
jgi:hypothetical protein